MTGGCFSLEVSMRGAAYRIPGVLGGGKGNI